jgi:hypothetical protein
MVSRLKSRASLEWDSPTPPPHGPASLFDLDMLLSPAIDMTHFDNTKPIMQRSERARNVRLAKSWNGKPRNSTFSFRPDDASTPPRYGTRVLPTRAHFANTFPSNSTSLCETLPSVRPLSGWGPSDPLFVPVSWPLQSASFKRFPGSRVFDCNACPQSLDTAEDQQCVWCLICRTPRISYCVG